MLVIGTNISSIIVQRNVHQSSIAMQRSIERLSQGSANDPVQTDSRQPSAENRFQNVMARLTLETLENEFTTAKAGIVDVDLSQESALLTKHQILQQAGISLLAKANGIPAAALALLRD